MEGRRRLRNEWRRRLDKRGRRMSSLRLRMKENQRQMRECLRQNAEDRKFAEESHRRTAILLQLLQEAAAVIRANRLSVDETLTQ